MQPEEAVQPPAQQAAAQTTTFSAQWIQSW
jgi:hypothetical protein